MLASVGSGLAGPRPLLLALALLVSIGPMSFSIPSDPADFAAGAQEAVSGAQGGGYDRPAESPKSSRSAVIAPHAMVATSQPLAAMVGIEILRAGGNAVDAAVAVNAMLGLVEPHMNGVGGDLFAIVRSAEDGEIHGLNATGRAPYALTPDVFHERGLERVPSSGPLSWTVPGAVDGWERLLERFGTMSLEQVLAPAIRYAREGFPVSEIIAGQWQAAEEELAEWPSSAATYLPGGRAPRVGEVFRNPDLAATYERIAAGGAGAFYRGAIAERIAAFSDELGGFLGVEDFRDHDSDWVEPVSAEYRGHRVWELPPNSQGIVALMMLNLLESWDLASLGHNSAATLHRMIEAKKLAFADRDRWVADPEAASLPVRQLISGPYADHRRGLIDPERAARTVDPGDPLEHGDTVYLTVVDEDRNMVSLIQSIFSSFGSKVVPADLGFALQNRGTGFSLESGHPNQLQPHKRSLHTNMPGLVTRDGEPWLAFGVMGGNMQPQGHTQVLANLIDFGLDVQEAGDAARFRHLGDDPEPGEAPTGGTVLVESGVPDDVVAALEALGHRVRRAGGGWMGGYQAVLIDPETGMLHGGTDPRKDGVVIGY